VTAERLIVLDQIRDIPSQEPNDDPDHSWRPLNLVQLAANPPEPPTIGGLLYPGKRTVLSGETESMKTWFALILTKAELDAGKPVCWVDLDAMGAGAMLQRLELLGVTHTQIHDSFHYIEPTEMLDPHKISELQTLIHNQGVRMFVIDAFNPILNLHGLDPNSNTDIETFWRTIAAPIAQAGAAPVLLDHVVKNADNRGKYSTGSERKASGVDGVHLGFKLLEPLRKGGTGRTLLSVHKDRPGYLPRPALGRLILDATGDHITYQIEPDQSHSEDGRFRPTVLMEKVSTYLELSGTSATGSEIEKSVTGNAKALRTPSKPSSKTATSPAAKEQKEPSSTPQSGPTEKPTNHPHSVRPQFVLSSSSTSSQKSSSIRPPPTGGRRRSASSRRRTRVRPTPSQKATRYPSTNTPSPTTPSTTPKPTRRARTATPPTGRYEPAAPKPSSGPSPKKSSPRSNSKSSATATGSRNLSTATNTPPSEHLPQKDATASLNIHEVRSAPQPS
jgi:hypothetical protein